MTVDTDDITVNAYVDHELDEAKVRAFEALLFRDPALMSRVREVRERDHVLRNVLSGVAAVKIHAQENRRLQPRPRTARTWGFAGGIAAALVASVMLGYFMGPAVRSPAINDHLVRMSTLQSTLESAASGTFMPWSNQRTGSSGRVAPISTYRNASGEFCREFEEQHLVSNIGARTGGIACRDHDGKWQVKVRYFP